MQSSRKKWVPTVTLNITVITPTVIFQSCDYRLSDPKSGQPENEPSTKILTVSFKKWSGFLTYAGIGRMGSKETSEFAAEWFQGRSNLSFDQATELIRERSSSWVHKVASRYSHHTFVLAAFTGSRATVAIISNYQRWPGSKCMSVSSEMLATKIKSYGSNG